MEKSKKSLCGIARSRSLTPERRKEIATKASHSRNKNQILKVTHGSDERPLVIGNIKIPCFVLSDGRRVLIQKEMATAIGLSKPNGNALSTFIKGKFLEGLLSPRVIDMLSSPIKVKTPSGNNANGCEATILVDICEAVLHARKNGLIQRQQEKIASQCETLMVAFAKTGVIALIDEATGYQANRAKDELAKILNAFIADELQPYVSMFPQSFFKELFRLRGLNFLKDGVKNPRYFGHLVNNIIYKRLAPGVFDELKRKTPIGQSGYKLAKYFQSLNPDRGMKALIGHLGCVQGLMEISLNYADFMILLDKVKPIQIDIPQDLIDSNLDQFEEHKSQQGI
jgi:hypothetical protein